MKHNNILVKLETLESRIGRLDSLVRILEEGDCPQCVSDKSVSDAEYLPLAIFLERTPGKIDNLSDWVDTLVGRINIILEPQECKVKSDC
jgi:hypothetical protein